MTGLVMAMAGITAFVSYLHTQHDPGTGSVWLILALVMAVTGVVAGSGFVYVANRDITRNTGEIARVACAVEVGDLD